MTDPASAALRLRAYLNATPSLGNLGSTIEYGPEFTAANGRPAGVYALDRDDLMTILDWLDRTILLADAQQAAIHRMARESLHTEAQVDRIRAWATSTQHGPAAAELLQLLDRPGRIPRRRP